MLLRYLAVKLNMLFGSLLWVEDKREFTLKSDSGGK